MKLTCGEFVGLAYANDDELREFAEEILAENAKLRKLAKAAWSCVNRHVSCDECRVVCGGCTLQSTMHELGIEVTA
jgi:hypothetical protein